jgi:hypothetical protein
MTKDLTNLHPHIEEMRTRLSQTADTERSQVQNLSDALNHIDQQLLQEIRRVGTEHQDRRGAILNELQALAGNMGLFLPTREPVEPATQQQIDYGHQYTPPPTSGDWRQATRNVDGEFENIQDELTFHLTGKRSH